MVTDIKQLISEKEFALHRIETLVIFLVSAGILLISVIIPFIATYTTNAWIHLIVFFVIEATIIGCWYYNRSIFPKPKGTEQNIVIAIVTENAKQKNRIRRDFAEQIEKRLREHDLSRNYGVVVLHNHLSRITQNKINLFVQASKANLTESDDVQKFNRLKDGLNAKFIVYGDLIQRNPGNSTYCLSLEGMIIHKPTFSTNGKTLHKELMDLWRKEVTFLENHELTGFKENAEHIFFTTSYMIGLATFLDFNFEHGIKIWEELERYVKDKPDLDKYKSRIHSLKYSAILMQSEFLYHKGEIRKSLRYREMYRAKVPNEYDKYLTEAIKQVNERQNPKLALEFVEKARKISGKDGTWKYSKFYLLIMLNHCEQALKVLDSIIASSFQNELITISQVINYNINCLKNNPTHIQSNFIIGSILYKKFKKPIEAYEKLEAFNKAVDTKPEWQPLQKRAQKYLSEIDSLIGADKR